MNHSIDAADVLRRAQESGYFMLWLYDLPTWLFAALTITFFVLLALGGLRLFHRRINEGMFATLVDNGTIGWFFSGITVLYGLLLGLLTVATWSSFTAAGGLASQEAASLSVLYRDLSGYPAAQRELLQSQLRRYTEFIVRHSWPAQRRGFINDSETTEIDRFREQFMAVEPHTEGDKLLHGEALRAFNSVTEFRRLRAESISGSVPAVIWDVVLIGALLTLVFSYFFLVRDFRLHAMLTGMLAAMISGCLFS